MKYAIEVTGYPKHEVKFLRTIRKLGRPTLSQAYDILRYLRVQNKIKLVTGLSDEQANDISSELESTGLKVNVTAANGETPMLCIPSIKKAYKWSFGLLRQS